MADERTAEEREAARRAREARRQVDGDGAPARAAKPPRPPRAPRQPRVPRARPERQPRPRGSHSRRNRIVAFVALLVAALVVWFCVEIFQPFHGSGHGSVTVVIPPHSGVNAVADRLARAGVIGSSFFFELRATLDGDRGDLHPGTYHLKLGMSFGSALDALTAKPKAAPVTQITITPGRTRRKIDGLLRAQGVKGSYYADTRSSRTLDPSSYGAPKGTNSLEGFLFPDTYQVREPISIRTLVSDQLQDFKRHFSGVSMSYARSKHLSSYDVLTIASMIEGEAQTAGDRARVASVIYNRLAHHMPLQIDATTRYATNNYTRPLTESQLHSSSPWNTYTHTGLPPTPIGNPGLSSIQAAAHPANTNDLYFVVKVCGNGSMVFESSYKQFQSDVARYQTARARRGGNSPAKC